LTTTQPQATSDVAFAFVRSLAAELSGGRIDLPSFPEIAIRVRRVLADENSTLEKVVRVVGSEPALAARLLRIANSASLNTTGKPIADLRTAINRMGYNTVRSASMSFAMAQIRNNNKLVYIKPYLDDLWERSTHVAALAYVLARRCTKINPDEAMLTGTMHVIGKLYVLTRVADHPELFSSSNVVNEIIDEWHAQIGRAILENWDFAEDMVAAVGDQNDPDRDGIPQADLGDVIATAILMASFETDPEGLLLAAAGLASPQRLGLDRDKLAGIVQESAAEIAELRRALGAA
jgi:HD-like signal output (HDOD) protein